MSSVFRTVDVAIGVTALLLLFAGGVPQAAASPVEYPEGSLPLIETQGVPRYYVAPHFVQSKSSAT